MGTTVSITWPPNIIAIMILSILHSYLLFNSRHNTLHFKPHFKKFLLYQHIHTSSDKRGIQARNINPKNIMLACKHHVHVHSLAKQLTQSPKAKKVIQSM
jgi:hypothetical protein